MLKKILVILSLVAASYSSFAAVTIKNNPGTGTVNMTGQKINNQPESPVVVSKMNNLNGIDRDSDDINQLNRKITIEKAEAELKKIKNGAIGSIPGSGGNIVQSENAQTTVTGVAINQSGKRIAWLQFADGGSLIVNIGSRVGKYTVSDISMTGVILQEITGTKHKNVQHLYLKRVYASVDAGKKSQSNNGANNVFFTPSPVFTDANTRNNENVVVPPIVTK